jgi:hypothetical protein
MKVKMRHRLGSLGPCNDGGEEFSLFKGSLCFLLLGGGSRSKLRRGSFPPDLLRAGRGREPERLDDRLNIRDLKPSSSGEQTGVLPVVTTGEHSFEALLAVAFLPFGLITLSGTFRLASAVGFV